MAQTPKGGHRDTQWVIQGRKISGNPGAHVEIPHEETTWTRLNVPQEITLSGPAVRDALARLRADSDDTEWRAIRVETVQRVEDW